MINLLLPAPTPAAIAAARHAAGLSQTAAGALVGYTLRGWQDAESGRRNISAAAWALFLLATDQHQLLENKCRKPIDTHVILCHNITMPSNTARRK